MSPIHNWFGSSAVKEWRVTPCSSTWAHRSSWTGGPGFFALPFLGLPNTLHQPLFEQIRHAVRWDWF